MTAAAWQAAILAGLEERDARERAFDPIIEQYRRLAQQTLTLKERNRSLLKAATSVVPTSQGGSGVASDSSVARAYTVSLEGQLATLREELATLYKTQGQNAQRLLLMNEALREREERSRTEEEELKHLRTEVARLRERVSSHAEVMREKERNVQIVQDELATLQLEYVQLELRNDSLKKDNASLLQRWLDRMNADAEKMNDATAFLNDAERKGMQSPKSDAL